MAVSSLPHAVGTKHRRDPHKLTTRVENMSITFDERPRALPRLVCDPKLRPFAEQESEAE